MWSEKNKKTNRGRLLESVGKGQSGTLASIRGNKSGSPDEEVNKTCEQVWESKMTARQRLRNVPVSIGQLSHSLAAQHTTQIPSENLPNTTSLCKVHSSVRAIPTHATPNRLMVKRLERAHYPHRTNNMYNIHYITKNHPRYRNERTCLSSRSNTTISSNNSANNNNNTKHTSMAAHEVHALRSHKTDLGVRRNVDDHVFLHTNVMHVHRHRIASHSHEIPPPPPSCSVAGFTSETVSPPPLAYRQRKDDLVMKDDGSKSSSDMEEYIDTVTSSANNNEPSQTYNFIGTQQAITKSNKNKIMEDEVIAKENASSTENTHEEKKSTPTLAGTTTEHLHTPPNENDKNTNIPSPDEFHELVPLTSSPITEEHYQSRSHYHVRFLSASTMSIPGLLSNCTSPTVLSTRSFDLQNQPSQPSYALHSSRRGKLLSYEYLEEEEEEEFEHQQHHEQEARTPLTSSTNDVNTSFSVESKSLLVPSEALPKPLPSGNDTISERASPVAFPYVSIPQPPQLHSRRMGYANVAHGYHVRKQTHHVNQYELTKESPKVFSARNSEREVINTRNNNSSGSSSNNRSIKIKNNNDREHKSKRKELLAFEEEYVDTGKSSGSNNSKSSSNGNEALYLQKQNKNTIYTEKYNKETHVQYEQKESKHASSKKDIRRVSSSSTTATTTAVKKPYSSSSEILTLEDAIAAVMETDKLAKWNKMNTVTNNNNNNKGHTPEMQVASMALPPPPPPPPPPLQSSVSVFGLFAMLERATRFEEFASLRRRYGPLLEPFLDDVATHLHSGHLPHDAQVLHAHACLMHILSSPSSAEKIGEEFYSDPANAWPLHMLYLVCCFYVTVQQSKSNDLFTALQRNRGGLLTLGKGIFAALAVALSSSLCELAQRTAEMYLAAFYVGVVMRSQQQSLERHLEFASHRNFALLLVNIPIFTLRQLIDQVNRSRCVHLYSSNNNNNNNNKNGTYNYNSSCNNTKNQNTSTSISNCSKAQYNSHTHSNPYSSSSYSSSSHNKTCPVRPYSTIEISRVISSRSAIVCGHPLDLIKLDIVLTRYADFNGVKIHKDYIPATAPENSMYYNKSMVCELLHYWDSQGIAFNPNELCIRLYSPLDGEVWTRETLSGKALFTQQIAEAVTFRNQDLTYSLQHLQNNDVLLDFSLHTLSVGPLIAWSHKQSRVLSLPANKKEGSVLPPPRRGTYGRSLRNTLHKLAIINEVIQTLSMSQCANRITEATSNLKNNSTKDSINVPCFVELYTSFVKLGYLRLVNPTDNEAKKNSVAMLESDEADSVESEEEEEEEQQMVMRKKEKEKEKDEDKLRSKLISSNVNKCNVESTQGLAHNKNQSIDIVNNNNNNLTNKKTRPETKLAKSKIESANPSSPNKEVNVSISERQSNNSHDGPTSSSSVTQNTTSINNNYCYSNSTNIDINNNNNKGQENSSPLDCQELNRSPLNESTEAHITNTMSPVNPHPVKQNKERVAISPFNEYVEKMNTIGSINNNPSNMNNMIISMNANALANSPRVLFADSTSNTKTKTNNTKTNTTIKREHENGMTTSPTITTSMETSPVWRKMPMKSTSTNSLFTSSADPTGAIHNVSANASPLHMSICNVITNKDKHTDNSNNKNSNIIMNSNVSAHYASSVNHSHNIYSQINQAMTSFATPIVGSIPTKMSKSKSKRSNNNIVVSSGNSSGNNNMGLESKDGPANTTAVFLLPSIGATANRSQTTYPTSSLNSSPVHQLSDLDSRDGKQHGMFSFNARSDVHDGVITSSEGSRLPSAYNTPAMNAIVLSTKKKDHHKRVSHNAEPSAIMGNQLHSGSHHSSEGSSGNNSNREVNKARGAVQKVNFSASLTSYSTPSHESPRPFERLMYSNKKENKKEQGEAKEREGEEESESSIVENNDKEDVEVYDQEQHTCFVRPTSRRTEDGIAGEEYVIKRNMQYTDVINVYQVSPLIKYYEMQFGCVMREDAIHFMSLLRAKTNIDFPLYALLLCPTVFALLEL